jgi:hypothetical protein
MRHRCRVRFDAIQPRHHGQAIAPGAIGSGPTGHVLPESRLLCSPPPPLHPTAKRRGCAAESNVAAWQILIPGALHDGWWRATQRSRSARPRSPWTPKGRCWSAATSPWISPTERCRDPSPAASLRPYRNQPFCDGACRINNHRPAGTGTRRRQPARSPEPWPMPTVIGSWAATVPTPWACCLRPCCTPLARRGVLSERLTSPLTVRVDLGKRRSAQRWAATYSHGGVLPGTLTSGLAAVPRGSTNEHDSSRPLGPAGH